MEFVAVGLGGMIGSILRYSFTLLFKLFDLTNFPWATLTVNAIGCFIAGMGLGFLNERGINNNLYLLLVTGFCGGFTTFSAFGIETVTLFRQGATTAAFLNVSGQITIGLAFSFLGFQSIR